MIIFIQSDSFWAKKLKDTCGRGWVVLRPLLIQGSQYVRHLKKMEGWNRKKIQKKLIDTLARTIRGYYWMIEVSYPQLFPANQRKLGEILLRADVKPKSERDLESFFLARLPDAFYFIEKIRGNGEAEFASLSTGIEDHVDLFKI